MKNKDSKKKTYYKKIDELVVRDESNYKIPKRLLNKYAKQQQLFNEWLDSKNEPKLVDNNNPDVPVEDINENVEQKPNDEILFDNNKPTFLEDNYDDLFDENKKPKDKKKKDDQSEEIEQQNCLFDQLPQDDPTLLLDVRNLRKRYTRKAKPAIDGISFQVRTGEFHAFVGANGAGKTTTIKSIVGAYAKFEGEVRICRVDNKNKLSRAKLGYIPEIARFPARISAHKYLKNMALLNGLSKEEAENFTNDILEKFNMTGLKNVCPNNFSSGQKKKILLGQALSNNPDILIMDEPAANLDPRSRIEFFDILKDLQKQGKSIFISSHILSELDIYANAVTILDGGKIVYTGKRKENESFGGYKFAYRIYLKPECDFKGVKTFGLSFEQDKENKNLYIVYSNDKKAINDFVSELFSKQRLLKTEVYTLSIEDLYKKYVIKGSVHTSN